MSLILEAKNINKYFGKNKAFHVLKDIFLEVHKSEFATIMGKSGSGKSTLLYILSTMDTDYTGEIFLNEQLITGKNQRELAHIRNKQIGFVFQFHYLLPEFSVLENVMLPAKKLGLKTSEEITEDAIHILKSLHIENLASNRASRISGGEKQRVAVARALINEPLLLMGDEPTGNLDSYNSENLFDILKSLKEEKGLSLLIVTHDEDFAKKTDRTIILEDGKIAG
ncbi:ATP-binding protein [Christiangramia fulva]|uniref:ATP-binding protein n=1 Tax=Christiangramia fulva TaxID=2126553 RepID=A0A2R3Z5Q0_9FLAO|nr:ABC transporter ATP-binding protein [Christiangramia fulva]AVR45579.1 ATP-binding protein [Christiangramia fulva]